VETRTTSPASEPAFHADDLDVASYRTLSGLAIVSLVIGLVAPLCFAFPVLFAIPLFGIGVALVTLRRIDQSEGALAGRGAAVVGLALCVASLAATLAHAQMTRFLHVRQAEDFARQWMELVSGGKLEQAFNWTATGARPAPGPEPGAPEPKETPLESFMHNPVIEQLVATGAGAEVRLAETASYEPLSGDQCIVRQRFIVVPAGTREGTATPTGSGGPVEALLTIQRSRMPGETRLQWLVANYQDPAQAALQFPGI
jgi:hypothetical protein